MSWWKAWILPDSICLKYYSRENILNSLLLPHPHTHHGKWLPSRQCTEQYGFGCPHCLFCFFVGLLRVFSFGLIFVYIFLLLLSNKPQWQPDCKAFRWTLKKNLLPLEQRMLNKAKTEEVKWYTRNYTYNLIRFTSPLNISAFRQPILLLVKSLQIGKKKKKNSNLN